MVVRTGTLLVSSGLAVRRVYCGLGFSAPSSFAHFFGQVANVSPEGFEALGIFPGLVRWGRVVSYRLPLSS